MKEYKVKVYDGGRVEWWLNGFLHREDGPAVVEGDYQRWFLHGVEYTEDEFNAKISPAKELTIEQISNLLGYEVKIVK